MITLKELIKKHYILRTKKVNLVKPKRPFYSFEGFGIECGKGWYDILDRLCTNIEQILDRDVKDLKLHFYITQIKEKFGGLRFYTSCCTDEIEMFIRAAEKESYKTCEECGRPGKCNKGGWLSVLCDKCKEERDKRFNCI
jgi:hypothetical protein